MKYPQSWTTVPKQEPVIFNVKTLDGLVNVVVTEEKRPEGATAEQYCEAEIKSLKNDIKSFQLVSHEPFEVKDADARQIVLTQTYDEGTDHALKLEQRQVVVFGPSKTYTVSTACPVELTETFDKPIDDMFSSISINKSGSEQE